MGTARWFYNRTVAYLREKGTVANWRDIRNWMIPAAKTENPWTTETPFQIRAQAIKEACVAVKVAKRKFRETGTVHGVSFRARRDESQTIYILKQAFKAGGVYPKQLGRLKSAEPIDVTKIPADARILWRNGKWYLLMPYTKDRVQLESQGLMVALDPGVRSFLTYYSQIDCGKIGDADMGRIVRLAMHLDDLLSRCAKGRKNALPSRQRYRMRQAADRLRDRIRNLIDEMHNKAIRFLVDRYDVIVCPRLDSMRLSNRKTRKINRKTVRNMLTFSHGRFLRKLKEKAFETGRLVVECSEAYTSKTLSWSGEIINVGSRKTVSDGTIKMDRDINGARGIFLRALADRPDQLTLVSN